ncbi:tensin-1-like isoform X3 [Gigantopelta aegis]|uniref:tensin-1-like isoform X3 n=1 Tax=Gigantopelta aegis TaxID=1735272 RepID=UPI001B88B43A|nr:tensin-1-like isoform X3 [Gigantopelta aegis]
MFNGQVMTTCVPQVSNELSNDTLTRHHTSSPPVSSLGTKPGVMSNLRDMINRGQQDQFPSEDGLVLDLTYITERIIAMSFIAEGHDTTYRFNLKEVTRMLKTKHGDKHLVLNISEKHNDLTKMHSKIKEFGWPDHLAPPLERLCSICKSIDSWLNADPLNVVVLHCKGGKGRLANVIAAYMHYSNICASADGALDRFAMKRFYDDKLGGISQPSQRRYVHYFAGLLSGAIKINSNALYLHHILIHGVPNFDTKGGCRPYIKVYQGMQPIFTSGVYNVTDNMQKVCISISPGIPLRGDILIKCYNKKTRSGQREIIWRCQFHTCAISDYNLVFTKSELDEANTDPRFADTGKVEFVFGPTAEGLVSVTGFKSDVTVPVDDGEDGLTRSDSYENFLNLNERIVETDINENGLPAGGISKVHVQKIEHSQGPVDGSLYATVNKRKLESHVTSPTSSVFQNGPTHLQNGSITSSLDSGYTGQSSSHLHQSRYTSSDTSDLISPTYSSNVHGQKTSFSSNTMPRQTVKALDERTQLDELLSDLLHDQSFSSLSSPSQQDAKTVTTTTRTFTSYSTTDSSPGQNVSIQRAEVVYKLPGQQEEKHHYMITPGIEPETTSGRKPGIPKNAFSYTSPISPTSPSSEMMETEVVRGTESMPHLQSSQMHGLTQTLPYNRSEFDNRYETHSYSYHTMDGTQMRPDSDMSASWLAQQQEKLRAKQVVRSPQEKQLVAELRSVQNKYYTRRTQNEAEEQAVMDTYNQQPIQNGPVSPTQMMITQSYQPPVRSRSHDGMWSPSENKYNTFSSSQMTTMENRTYGDQRGVSNKPPPSPTLQRSMTPTQPIAPPVRTSSKDFMRSRSNSSSSWQPQQPFQTRPLQRQASETLFDRDPIAYNTYSTSHSPRALSPSQQALQHASFTTYRTIQHVQDDNVDGMQPQQQPQVYGSMVTAAPPPKPPPQTQQHYVTEVFVHRGPGASLSPQPREEIQDTTRLEALEKSLQAASESIMASSAPKQQFSQSGYQTSSYQTTEQHQAVVRNEIRSVEPQQSSVSNHGDVGNPANPSMSMQPRSVSPGWDNVNASNVYSQIQKSEGPPPKQIHEIEEDRIMLRPIGPGVQTLEPETHTGTLGRPTTPGFPTSPVTPPFPVTPRTPYVNTGGSTVVSPMGTLTQQQQNLQYQTQHTTQYHTQQQQHQQQLQQQQHQDGTLHIDTSQRMLSSPRSPGSAGSPPSPNSSLNTLRQQLSTAHSMSTVPHSMTGQSSPSVYFGLSRRGSLSSLADVDMVSTSARFVKDTSKYWYKPNITREEAIVLLKDKQPGTFVIRDSNSFPGAFGLAIKVATIPPNVQIKPSADPQADLVRHFLIEPTPKGVRLRGCSNEPVFGSLAALVYQHTITPLALPCKLLLPEPDHVDGLISAESHSISAEMPSSAAALLSQGAACNVFFLNTIDTESLTGPQAVARAVKLTFETLPLPVTTVVHFKVSSQGITLTDNNRKLFFRRHYPVSAVTYCGMDPEERRWKRDTDVPGVQVEVKIFGFVARKQGGVSDNACHLFAEFDPEQPASAIVNFVTKVMIGQSKVKS